MLARAGTRRARRRRGCGRRGRLRGAAHSDYLARNLADRYAAAQADPVGSLQAALSGVGDYLPLHVAHRLALTGPALTVGTACSTSLVAVHLAAQSLLAGSATRPSRAAPPDRAAGQGYLHVPDGIFSADGRVRAFSAEGTGIVHSQGSAWRCCAGCATPSPTAIRSWPWCAVRR
ncbi:beta-ketoacyl synthase N-terminal-like domain-containing protein [Streptomyces sp. M19]